MALGGALQLDNTVGAFEISVTLASLYVWKYSNDYQQDPWYMKALVATVFVGNMFHQLCLNHAYVLLSIPWFYVYRIWRLSNRNYLLTCPLAAISVAEFNAVDEARRITVYTDQVKIKDCLLAGTMMLLLLKSRTRFKKTNTMITRLMIMAALLTIITLAIWDETMIDHPFYLYGASLFGLLNARNDIRNGTPNNGYSSNEIPLSLARSAHTAAAPIQSLSSHSVDTKPSHIMVSVSRETDGHDERSMGKERGFESV
ncbi:hypothetical protein F5146DRAFT_1072515 [Armillaria mellea]|nr:hypothetical protein F5146DRAFT_1072515 [Armillaria mellea]